MQRLVITLLVALSLPTSVYAAGPASFKVAREIFATSSAPGNAYTAGTSVVVTAPTAGDLSIIAGSITAAGPVGGDELLVGGSLSARAPVKGDLRAVGAGITITEAVGGDLVAIGYRVDDLGRAGGSVFVIAANASLAAGAEGPVTIYGNNVRLEGDFASDVRVVAGGTVTLGDNTTIHGTFAYEAPDTARIPESATIMGGIEYTNASYLPDAGTSRTLALASIGVFLLVRILGALILAGLLAGLFPDLARTITDRAYTGRVRSLLLTTLLGFAALVATPILLLLLALTFVGLGVAVLVFIGYVLLVALAGMYAGILLGTLLVRRFTDREAVLWHDGVLGMLILSLIALVPIIGWLVAALLTAFAAGTLLVLFFRLAFPHE